MNVKEDLGCGEKFTSDEDNGFPGNYRLFSLGLILECFSTMIKSRPIIK